jgi:hypothetical protein
MAETSLASMFGSAADSLAEAMGEGRKPFTTIHTPSENSHAAIGSARTNAGDETGLRLSLP